MSQQKAVEETSSLDWKGVKNVNKELFESEESKFFGNMFLIEMKAVSLQYASNPRGGLMNG